MTEHRQRIVELERQADAHRASGDLAQAIKSYQEILALDPQFVRAHLALALLYDKTGDYRTAVDHAEKVNELEPGDPLNLAALSVIYQKAFEATRDPSYIQKAEAAKARSH
jgi:tetratricopeptide (TPR) repeat protein